MARVIAICLDGYDPGLGLELMRRGEMPEFVALSAASARFQLDHGADLRTGLAGEHIATGLAPSASGRAAAVHVDPQTYEVWQEGTRLTPFPSTLPVRTVVFDATYFDLARAPTVRGVVNWGAHDPGVAAHSQPSDLFSEMQQRFGDYPAKRWIYGLPWNSTEACREMGTRLTQAVDARAEAAEWLLAERLPDWDLALVTVSEAHSVIEGMWHGVDPGHPLHIAPSAAIAGEGVVNVYRAVDRLVGRLRARFPQDSLLLFSMHGMGANSSDAASMLLLAELLYRDRFGGALFDRRGEPRPELGGRVALPQGQTWVDWIAEGFPPAAGQAAIERRRKPETGLQSLMRRILPSRRPPAPPSQPPGRIPVQWIPASRYRPYWPQMPAFARPAYYDGQVRINLQGREKQGIVPLSEYSSQRERLAQLVLECRDPVTGRPVVGAVDFNPARDPLRLGNTDSDLVIVWSDAPQGFTHPRLGDIGPVPYRRTGGHTGGHGFAWLAGAALAPGDHGLRSAFDVVPTVLDMLGSASGVRVSGASLLGRRAA